ncbi:MAG: rhodanese-like domain-containing protein [Acidobacteria bacterium]|nr:rhodanese-like domain-containing protein [Acidobacteriota bacterium]
MSDTDKQLEIEKLYARSKKQFPGVEDLTVEELDRLREIVDVVPVDVRNPPEQAVSMIPGSITSTELESDPSAYAGRTLVTYCTIGHRSGLYAQKLQAAGFTVFNLKGAILAWTHAQRELVDAEGSTRKVHVGGPRSSLESSDYDPVW